MKKEFNYDLNDEKVKETLKQGRTCLKYYLWYGAEGDEITNVAHDMGLTIDEVKENIDLYASYLNVYQPDSPELKMYNSIKYPKHKQLIIGKEALECLKNNNYLYSSLNIIADKFEITIDTAKKYLEKYAEYLSVFEPDSKEMALYNEIIEMKKNPHNKTQSIILELLSLKSSEIFDYLASLSPAALRNREELITKCLGNPYLTKDEIAKFNLISEAFTNFKAIRSDNMTKANVERHDIFIKDQMDKTKKILREYLNSSEIKLDNLPSTANLTNYQISDLITKLNDYDEEGKSLVMEYQKELEERRASILNVIKEMYNDITENHIGIGFINDYYKIMRENGLPAIRYDLFLSIARKLNRQKALNRITLSALEKYSDPQYANSPIFSLEEMLAYDYSETISRNGEIIHSNDLIGDDDKFAIAMIMKDLGMNFNKTNYISTYHNYFRNKIKKNELVKSQKVNI